MFCSYLEVSSDRFEIMEKEPKIVESTEDGEIKGKSCQIIPGGFAGTGPNGSFFECPEWVDQSKVWWPDYLLLSLFKSHQTEK